MEIKKRAPLKDVFLKLAGYSVIHFHVAFFLNGKTFAPAFSPSR